MTNEIVKKPSTDPVTIANNANQALYKNHREWREYVSALEEDVKTLSERVIELGEQIHAEKDARKKEYEIHQDIYSKTAKELNKSELKIADLNSKLQQQALPVVPEDVAKLPPFDDMKEYVLDERLLTIREYLNKLDDKSNSDITEAEAWCLIHEDIAYRAMLDGYTVEKPQLFYLKNKLTGDCLAICLARASSGLYVEVTEKWLTRKEQTSYKLYFTQQEINSMQTGSYEQIPVPVEDGE